MKLSYEFLQILFSFDKEISEKLLKNEKIMS